MAKSALDEAKSAAKSFIGSATSAVQKFATPRTAWQNPTPVITPQRIQQYQQQIQVNKQYPFFNQNNTPQQWVGKVIQDTKRRGLMQGLQDLSNPVLMNPYVMPIAEPVVSKIRVANYKTNKKLQRFIKAAGNIVKEASNFSFSSPRTPIGSTKPNLKPYQNFVKNASALIKSPAIQAPVNIFSKGLAGYSTENNPFAEIFSPNTLQQAREKNLIKYPDLYRKGKKTGKAELNPLSGMKVGLQNLGLGLQPGGTAIAGALNIPFKAATNILEGKKPLDQDFGKTFGEGVEFGAQLGPLSKISGVALSPVLSKFNPKEIKTAVDVMKRLISRGAEGGTGFGAFGALEPAKDFKERLTNVKDQAIMGALFDMGIAGTGLAGKKLVSNIRAIIKEVYKMTPQQQQQFLQAGFLRFPGSEKLNKEQYTAEIKARIEQERADLAINREKYKKEVAQERRGSRGIPVGNIVTEKEKLFREYAKNPDAFIEKYNLLPKTFGEEPKLPIVQPGKIKVKQAELPRDEMVRIAGTEGFDTPKSRAIKEGLAYYDQAGIYHSVPLERKTKVQGKQTWKEFEVQRNEILSELPKDNLSIHGFIRSTDIEPQVRDAVMRLNKAGHTTNSSGFAGEGSLFAKLNDNKPTHTIDGFLKLTDKQISDINASGLGKVVRRDDMAPGYQVILVDGNKDLGVVKNNFNKIVDIIESSTTSPNPSPYQLVKLAGTTGADEYVPLATAQKRKLNYYDDQGNLQKMWGEQPKAPDPTQQGVYRNASGEPLPFEPPFSLQTTQKVEPKQLEVSRRVSSKLPVSGTPPRGGQKPGEAPTGGSILDQLAADRARAREIRSKEDKITDLGTWLKSHFLDDFAFAEKADPELFMNMRLLSGGGKARTQQIVKEGLEPILQKEANRLEDFSNLISLQRLAELSGFEMGGVKFKGRGLERSLTPEEIGRGLTDLLNKVGPEAFGEMKQSAVQLRKFLDRTLTMLVKSGIISRESAKNARAKNQFYVTFETIGQMMRQKGEGGEAYAKRSFNVAQQNVFKGIGESTTGISDPLEATLLKVMRTINIADKNSILLDFVTKRPELVQFVKEGRIPSEGKDIFSLFKNGKKTDVEADKDLVAAIKHLEAQPLNWALKIMAKPTTLLKAGAVHYNPIFLLVNPMRDLNDAMVVEGSTMGLRESGKLLGGYLSTLVETSNQKKQWANWVKSGGSSASFFQAEVAKTPELTIKQLAGQETLGVVKSVKHIFDFLGRTGEEVSRLAKFKKDAKTTETSPALAGAEDVLNAPFAKIPKNIRQAAFSSRNITLDFARMGSYVRTLNQLIPFFNVGVQGSDKVINLIKRRPVGIAKTLAVMVGVPSTILYVHNRNFQDFKDLADFEKDTSMIFMIRDRTPEEIEAGMPVQAFKMPKGNIAGPFMNVWEQFLQFTDTSDPAGFADTILNSVESISPVGIPIGGDRARRMLSKGMFQFARLPIELATNTDLYTGRKIIPRGLEGIEPKEQYGKYTSPLAKTIGKVTGISPLYIEHAGETIGAQVGKFAVNPQSLITSAGGIGTPNTRGRFLGAYGGQTDNTSYKKLDDITGETKTESLLKKRELEGYLKESQRIAKEEGIAKSTDYLLGLPLDEDGLNSLTQMMREEEMKLGSFEKSLLNTSVDARARYIFDELSKFKNLEDQQLYLQKMFDQKILTPDTMIELQQLMESPPKKSMLEQAADNIVGLIPASQVSAQSNTSLILQGLRNKVDERKYSIYSSEVRESMKMSDAFKEIASLENKYGGTQFGDSLIQKKMEALGITRDMFDYDKKTLLGDDLQTAQIKSEVEGLNGRELETKLISMRYVSGGSRKALLTDTIINTLVKEDFITESMGETLKNIKWDEKTKTFSNKAVKGKKAKKFSLKRLPKIKVSKIKFSTQTPRFTPLKIAKPKKISLKEPKTKAPPKLKISPVKLNIKPMTSSLRGLGATI